MEKIFLLEYENIKILFVHVIFHAIFKQVKHVFFANCMQLTTKIFHPIWQLDELMIRCLAELDKKNDHSWTV
jgi:hypothetical protein